MKFVVSLLFFVSLQAQAAWDLNDVSYLLPLPTVVGGDALLGLEAPGKGGPLLEPILLGRVPILAIDMDREETYQALRVIAVRIDPCFPLPTPQSCQKQIRLVWQPLQEGRRRQTHAVDAALHSFYVLSDSEFANLLTDLEAWKTKYPVQTNFIPLQVHPAWAQQGDRSPALRDFQEIIKKYAGRANLTRVTAMVLRGAADMWAFAGFELRDGQLELFGVPRLKGRLAQSFVNVAVPSDHFAGGGMSPPPKGSDTFDNIVAESVRLGAGSEELIRQEVKAAYRIENPKNFSPENMDCVSCHVAQPAIQWVLRKRPELQVDQLWSSEIYKNAKYNLTNRSPEVWNTQMIRGLGYFGKNMAISQRVINESAEVADSINLLFNRQRKIIP
ncbi:hypothetical protein [Bdellovibrio sp.]|uniref:hypothetical protein n=1 Tax=Bdellovibrio sp. TaxID=28201 RepID=UPI0039E4EEB5